MSNLFGYDFRVKFCPGRLTTIADALSRRGHEDASLSMLSGPSFKLYDDLHRELQEDATLRTFCDSVVTEHGMSWHVVQGLVLRGTLVFMSASSTALLVVLQMAHSVGHEGIQKMLQRLRQDFMMEHDHRLVRKFVRACTTC